MERIERKRSPRSIRPKALQHPFEVLTNQKKPIRLNCFRGNGATRHRRIQNNRPIPETDCGAEKFLQEEIFQRVKPEAQSQRRQSPAVASVAEATLLMFIDSR